MSNRFLKSCLDDRNEIRPLSLSTRYRARKSQNLGFSRALCFIVRRLRQLRKRWALGTRMGLTNLDFTQLGPVRPSGAPYLHWCTRILLIYHLFYFTMARMFGISITAIIRNNLTWSFGDRGALGEVFAFQPQGPGIDSRLCWDLKTCRGSLTWSPI